MATENLKVKITADASQAKAEIGKFKDSLKGSIAAGESATKTLAKLTAATGTFALAIKGVKALIKNGVDIAAQGDAIKDNAQKVFMGTTAYQEWGYVLKQNGVEIGALKVGMRKFSQAVATGSDSLKKYGITATDVDAAFEQAVYTIQNMSSETEKIAAATELFGSRALELFPILNLTNQETQSLMETYRAIGGTMSNELIAASDTCTDSIVQMKAAWGGLRNVLAAYVIPVITKIVQWITIAIAYLRILLKAFLGIKESFTAGGKKKSIAGTTGSVATNTGNTAKNLKKAAKHAKDLRRTMMGIDELSRLAEKATEAASSGGGGGGGGSISAPSIDTGDLESIDGVFSEDMLNRIEEFRKKVEAIAEPLNGVYLVLKGLTELAFGNPVKGLNDIWEGLKKIFPDLQKVEDGFAEIKKWVLEKREKLISIKLPTWNDIKNAWNNLVSNIQTIGAKINFQLPSAKGISSQITKLLGKVKSKTIKIKLNFAASVSDLKSWINNNVFSKINSVFAKVPILNKYKLRLAKGGVLTAPTEALLGEYAGARQNPEIATPQSLMYETIQKANGDLVGAFASMTQQVIAAIEGKDLSVSIGDETIARSAQRGNAAYRNRTGKALITV